MREIKFRAWVKDRTEMHEVMTIDFFNSKVLLHPDYDDCKEIKSSEIDLMQWTGLQDKNRIDIFEGDILKCHSEDYIGNVFFESGSFMSDCRGFGDEPLSLLSEDDIEIIGNIHENPELLK